MEMKYILPFTVVIFVAFTVIGTSPHISTESPQITVVLSIKIIGKAMIHCICSSIHNTKSSQYQMNDNLHKFQYLYLGKLLLS